MKKSHRVLLGLFGYFASACGGSAACPVLPCPLTTAVAVAVTSSATSAAIPGAFVQVAGGSPILCNQSGGDTCLVPGGAGTYQLVIGAPGFQSVSRTVTITALSDPGASVGCGCPNVLTQHLDVGLVATP